MNRDAAHHSSYDDEPPLSGLDQLLHAVEEAETDVTKDEDRRSNDGEAGDALTPNEQAQEDIPKRRP